MDKKELEKLREIEELIWEVKIWLHEADAKEIRDKIWQELVDKIEEYRKEY